MSKLTVNCIGCNKTFELEMKGEGLFQCPYCDKIYIKKYTGNRLYTIDEFTKKEKH